MATTESGMRLRRGATASLAAMLLILAGCRATPIPAGAQIVHVTVSPSEILLEPSTVTAGDVYLVLDAPADGSLVFVSSLRNPSATPGPLNAGDLARLAAGNTQGTMIDTVDAGGCSPDQNAEDRGKLGPCGNASKVVVLPGKYAVLSEDPAGDPATGRPPPMAVLEVRP